MKKGMSGWIWILIIILLIIIGATIFVFFYKDTYYFNKAIKENNPELCGKISKPNREFYCYGLIAIAKNDISLCLNSDKMYILYCFRTFAAQNNNIKSCEVFKGNVEETNCYTAFVLEHPDISICSSLQGDSKDFCYMSVAIQKNDISICSQIPENPQIPIESGYRATCENNVRQQQNT